MQHANDLQRVLRRGVDDRIGKHRPEFDGRIGQIFPAVACSWRVGEQAQCVSDLAENLPSDPNAGLLDQVGFDVVQIPLGLGRETVAPHSTLRFLLAKRVQFRVQAVEHCLAVDTLALAER